MGSFRASSMGSYRVVPGRVLLTATLLVTAFKDYSRVRGTDNEDRLRRPPSSAELFPYWWGFGVVPVRARGVLHRPRVRYRWVTVSVPVRYGWGTSPELGGCISA